MIKYRETCRNISSQRMKKKYDNTAIQCTDNIKPCAGASLSVPFTAGLNQFDKYLTLHLKILRNPSLK